MKLRLGNFGQGRTLTVLGVGLPVALVTGCAVGALYQGAFLWLPIGMNVPGLLLVVLGGGVIAFAGLLLRCRSPLLTGVLGVVAGLASDATSWAVALRHAREHDLVWVESETDAFLRRTRSSNENRDILVLRGVLAEEGRRAMEEMLREPPPPERLTETVRVRTLADYVGFRWRRGWPERGEMSSWSGLIVPLAWVGELAMFVGVAVWLATCMVRVKFGCAVHRQPMNPVLDVVVPDADHEALSEAAVREDLDAVVAVPRRSGGRDARFVLERCPSCDFMMLSVRLRWRSAGLPRSEVVADSAPVDAVRAEALRARLGDARP